MSREIKFRAFQKPIEGSPTDKQMREVMKIRWYQQDGVRCLPEEFQILIPCWPDDGSHAWCSTRSHYVMQFTGLLDEIGNEIFQGDVVKFDGHTHEEKFTAEIIEKNGGFWADRKDGLGDYLGNFKYRLIIGNIYENLELK